MNGRLKTIRPSTMDDDTPELIAFGVGVFAGGVAWGPFGFILGAIVALKVIRVFPIHR